jgi:hypothetical protein
MSHYLIAQIADIPNIEVRTGATALAAHGNDDQVCALTNEQGGK